MNDPELPKDMIPQTQTMNNHNQNEVNNEFLFNDITERFEEPALINEKNNDQNQQKNSSSRMINTQQSIIINNTNNSYFNNNHFYQETNILNQYFDNPKSKNDFSTKIDNNCYSMKEKSKMFTSETSTLNNNTANNNSKKDEFELIKESFNHENIKDTNRNYHSYMLLESLYDSLLLIGDFHLAFQISEIIYSTILIDPKDFINKNASLYYAYQRNLQFVSDLENIYYLNSECQVIPITNCQFEIGKFATQIMTFRPIIMGMPSDHFNLKTKNFEDIVNKCKFCQGDFVMIFFSAFPNQKEEFSFLAKIIEITSEFQIKLEALLDDQQLNLLNDQNKVWMMRKLSNVIISENVSKCLTKFCCSSSASYSISEAIVTLPNLNTANERNDNEDIFINKSMLNEAQKKALKNAISNALTLIDGPKNSGKTTTTIEIAVEW